MVAVCILLTMLSKQAASLANIIVNVVMFVLVALILLAVEKNSFFPINRMIAELKRVNTKIRRDAMNSHEFLWDQYRNSKTPLFGEEKLRDQYQDYLMELDRISHSEKSYYKCDIEEYINYDLVDTVIHRNQLNQVAGVMTGLGILGTFVGLSLGLNSFSTGTTAEITNSIAPLMDGIKVAFHTSIYGMVFSLVFNFVYKKKVDEAEVAVKQFLTSYRKYVLPDTTTDGINKLMELQEKQTAAIRSLATTVGRDLSSGLSEMLEPQFDRFDQTLEAFGNMATRNQLDALSVVINAFIAEMNKSLGNKFSQLAYTIDQTYLLQDKNAKLAAESSQNLENLQADSEKRIRELQADGEKRLREMQRDTWKQIQEVQTETAAAVADMRKISESHVSLLGRESQQLQELIRYQKAVDDAAVKLNTQLQQQEVILGELRKLSAQMPKDVDHTFRVIDDNLIEVETHFRDTILQIKEATDRVPQVIGSSYENLEAALNRVSASVKELSDVTDRMNRQSNPFA